MAALSVRIADRDEALDIAKAIIDERLAAVPEGLHPAAFAMARAVAEASTRRNLDLVHEISRSRTEVIFLTAIILAELDADPPGAVVSGPAADTDRYLAAVAENYRAGAARYAFPRRGLGSKLHVMLHPRISLPHREVVADALFWVPENPGLRILMDCERFHLGDESMLTDFATEKRLLAQGYATVRYSSEQVLVDPIAMAYDAFWHVVVHV